MIIEAVIAALTVCGVGGKTTSQSFPFEETVVVKGADVSADFAVQELNFIVSNATGRVFAFASASRRDGDGTVRRRILVGRSPEAEKILGAAFFEGLQDEESAVFAKGNDLFLVGGGQLGCLYAVYDFVEDNLRFRHYFTTDDGFVVDKVPEVVWKGVATRKRPHFTGYRKNHADRRDCALADVRNRSNANNAERIIPGYRFRLTPRIPGHGFNPFLLPPYDPRKDSLVDRLGIRGSFKEHPEWYSLGTDGKRHDDMQLCLSNPEARQKLLDNLILWIKARGAGVYMVGSNDNHNTRYCNCEGCVALERKYDSVGGPLWDWILWACPRLKELGYGDAVVSSLAYKGPTQTERAPKGVGRFPDNFNCDAAFLNFDRPLADVPDEILPDGTVFSKLANLKRWRSLCTHVSYWFYGARSPMEFHTRLQAEMRELADAGVESIGFDGSGGAYEFGDFTSWVAFRLMRDPNADLEPDLRRIFAIKYGPAAADVRAYADRLERLLKAATAKLRTTCGSLYEGCSFLGGDDLLALRAISDRALAKAEGTPFEQKVRESRIGLNIWTLTYFHKIKAADSAAAAKIDCAAVAGEARRTIAGLAGGKSNASLLAAVNEMANYANLENDDLPPQLGQYPKDKVFRILPPARSPHVCGTVVPGVYSCEADPKAVSGWAWMDTLGENYDASKGIGVEIYSSAERQWLWRSNQNPIPRTNFKKGEYTLWKLCTTRLPNRVCLVFANRWGSPTSVTFLGRLYDPTYHNRQWEIWISARGEGPKFFEDEDSSLPSRLWIDQIFCVDKGVPAGK